MNRRTTLLSCIVLAVFVGIVMLIVGMYDHKIRLGDVMFDRAKPNIISKLDYSKLNGNWLMVGTGTTGDTVVKDYFKDTLEAASSNVILKIGSNNNWVQLHSDYGTEGRYKIDTLNNNLLLLNVNPRQDDTVVVMHIVYMGKRCLLLQADSNKHVTEFYLRTIKEMAGTGG